ncbi:hypothetical protein GCM10010501_17160 [Streptomyces libani subsp. rufus]|nr:hypothetical protein GCM10010501_17160 [Streptomyces libani subsp. rufus]
MCARVAGMAQQSDPGQPVEEIAVAGLGFLEHLPAGAVLEVDDLGAPGCDKGDVAAGTGVTDVAGVWVVLQDVRQAHGLVVHDSQRPVCLAAPPSASATLPMPSTRASHDG